MVQIGGRDQGLHFDQQGPRPFHRRQDSGAGGVLSPLGQQHLRRVGDFDQALLMHLEQAQFVGRAKPIFDGPQDTVGIVPVALKGQHRVYHVFQNARPGQRAFFGDMADQEDGNAFAFGDLGKLGGGRPNLGDAARRRLDLRVLHRLDAVNDDKQGPLGLDRRRDQRHIRLIVQQQIAAGDAQPLRPQLDLRRRLLAGDVKRLAAARRRAGPRPESAVWICPRRDRRR